MSMIVIIPKNNTNLELVERSMKNIKISRLLSGKTTEISLSLPKFTMETKVNLVAPLMELGLTDMFDDSANFSDIVNTPVKVSKVVQKAFIEINEEGSEASAATGTFIIFLFNLSSIVFVCYALILLAAFFFLSSILSCCFRFFSSGFF